MLRRLTRHDLRAWWLPALLAGLLVALFVSGPALTESLRYERDAVLAGQAWRLLSGHLVHFDLAHLGWNLVGIALVWFLFAREFTPLGWWVVLVSSTAAIDLGFLAFEPRLDWYVGFSGVLHGCMAAGLVAWMRHERDALTVTVAVIFGAKLLWEHAYGPLPFAGGSLGLPVVHEAHTYGALGGAAAGLWLTRDRTAGKTTPL